MNMLKGMSINVNLSEEQMEHIASLSADKVNQTRTHYMNETELLQREVQDLRREVERRDSLIAENAIRESSRRELYKVTREENKKLKSELDELKGKYENDQNNDSVNP